MRTIYHKGGNSLTQPSTKISHRIKIVFPREKPMAPFHTVQVLGEQVDNDFGMMKTRTISRIRRLSSSRNSILAYAAAASETVPICHLFTANQRIFFSLLLVPSGLQIRGRFARKLEDISAIFGTKHRPNQ